MQKINAWFQSESENPVSRFLTHKLRPYLIYHIGTGRTLVFTIHKFCKIRPKFFSCQLWIFLQSLYENSKLCMFVTMSNISYKILITLFFCEICFYTYDIVTKMRSVFFHCWNFERKLFKEKLFVRK